MKAHEPSPRERLVHLLGIALICASLLFFCVSILWVGDSPDPNPLWFTVTGYLSLAFLAVGILLMAALSRRRRRNKPPGQGESW